MKVFLDTNVLVSGFTTRGLCADLIRLVLAEHELVVGEVVLKELERVLTQKLELPAAPLKKLLPSSNNRPFNPNPRPYPQSRFATKMIGG